MLEYDPHVTHRVEMVLSAPRAAHPLLLLSYLSASPCTQA